MGFTIDSVEDVGGDVLHVTATDQDGAERTASGWVSATTNHYDPASYDKSGSLVKGAQPRVMTAAEVGAYARQLIVDQHPDLVSSSPAPSPTAIPFQ